MRPIVRLEGELSSKVKECNITIPIATTMKTKYYFNQYTFTRKAEMVYVCHTQSVRNTAQIKALYKNVEIF